MVGFMANHGTCSIFYAELWGALVGLQLAWSLGLRRIILEVDNVADTLNKRFAHSQQTLVSFHTLYFTCWKNNGR
ncbi:hypothetical protein Scep_009295 [Stephania cephalantha]|uniref:RNase H type-1 domain-containing protein n=1 Tax=Stephania cephalantha TaxID=152367 RepID=A0AAP0PE64_9MAGN